MKRISKVALGAIVFGLALGGITTSLKNKAKEVNAVNSQTATFTFSSGAVSVSNNVGTMTAGSITMTQAKGSSSTDLRSPSDNPLRVYVGHVLTFTATAGLYIHQIEFSCNTTAYATALSGATFAPSTASISSSSTSKIVTWSSLAANSVSITMKSQVRLDSLIVTYDNENAAAANPTVSLSSNELHLAIGGSANSSITASSNDFANAVTWSVTGADAAIATAAIDSSTGVLTITPSSTAASTASETLTITGTDGTSTKSATLLVTIGEAYSLLSSTADLHPGKVIIANTAGSLTATKTLTSSKLGSTAVLAGSNVIYDTPEVNFFTIGLADVKDEYTIRSSDNKFLYGYTVTSGSNTYYDLAYKDVLDSDCYWTISLTSGTAILTSKGSTANSGSLEYYNNAFALYSGSNQLHLYQAATASLSSISITGTPNQQVAGQAPDVSNLVVTATFSDSATAVVTNWVTWAPSAIDATTTQLTASLTFGGVTKTAAVDVTVTTATLSSIAITTAPTKTVYTIGDTLSLDGMIVTATYSDSSTKIIAASDCTFSPADGTVLSTVGTTMITVTYQSKTATTAVTVNAKVLTIAKTGTDNTLATGNLPTNWDGAGNVAFATSKTAFKVADNYLQASNVVPSIATDVITTLVVKVFSVVNSTTVTDTITAVGLKDGTEISGSSTTFVPLSASANSASAVDNACIESNARTVYLSGVGINGVKLTLTTKNANWVVTNVNLAYYTEDETYAYNFLKATSVCDPTGVTNNVTTTIWDAQSAAFTALSAETFKNNIKTATANASGTIIQQAVARYDYIASKYNATLSNFMDRTLSLSSRPSMKQVTNEGDTVLMGIFAGLAFVSVVGFFLLKKKEQH